jgi:hypothetical protein
MESNEKRNDPISFEVSEEHSRALKALAGNRKVRLLGHVSGNKLVVDFVACNAPFVACNTAFNACNTAFNACNAPFNTEKE